MAQPRRTITMRIAAVLAVLATTGGAAFEPSDWSRVRALRPDTKIVVVIVGREPEERRFVAAEDTSLTTRAESGSIETVDRSTVREVSVIGTWAKRGAMIGGGAIVAVGAVNKASPEWFLIVGGIWAGFYAVVGHNFQTRKVIYHAG